MSTGTRRYCLYKIWRKQKGRSLKRWLTDEQVTRYRAHYPHWRWRKIQDDYGTVQARPRQTWVPEQASYSSSRAAWGQVCTELAHNRNTLRDKTTNPAISYDDILDTQLALNGARI